MRLLIVRPPEGTSTIDVYNGYFRALTKLGLDLQVYNLASRMLYHQRALEVAQKKKMFSKPYSFESIIELASEGLIYQAFLNRPDWILIISGRLIHPNSVIALTRAGFKVAWLFTECPYDDQEQLDLAQYVHVCFVDDHMSLEAFQKVNRNSFYLPKACDPEIHCRKNYQGQDVSKLISDVLFVGTGFEERKKIFQAIDWEGIDLKLIGPWRVGSRSKLRPFLANTMIDNGLTVDLYNHTKIALNLHRAGSYSANPRTFEISACGAFQICDRQAEVVKLFGDSIIYFNHPQELEELIRFWLPKKEKKDELGKRAQVVARENTFIHRAKVLLNKLEGGDYN